MTTYPYSSTHRLEEVDGERLRKDLSPLACLGKLSARLAGLEDPTREPAAYRHVLGPLGIGPRWFESGPDWIVLERLPGTELWQVGDHSVWIAVAAWVGHLHLLLAGADVHNVPLVVHDPDSFAAWRQRAALAGAPSAVLLAHERAVEQLLALPPSIIHGDLYPSNLLVQPDEPFRVWPVDWELIGRGPAVLDVAALTSGAWTDDERTAMADAYFEAAHPGRRSDWEIALDAARLHLCVQWLGSPVDWMPPPDHAHDWLSEALELTERL